MESNVMKIFLDGLEKEGNLMAKAEQFNLKFHDFEFVYFDSPKEKQYKDEIYPIGTNELGQEPVKQEKEWYLMGVDLKEASQKNKATDSSIFISLLNLGAKIDAGCGLYDTSGAIDELAFREDIKEWCMEFGLPYYEDHFSEHFSDDNGNYYYGFRLWKFKRSLVSLYCYFNLWYRITFDDIERINKPTYVSRLPNFDDLPVEEKIPLVNLNQVEYVTNIMEHLAFLVTSEMNAKIGVEYDRATKCFESVPYTNSLLSVAYFQFALLMTNNGTHRIAFCDTCTNLFEINHRGTKYCPECKRDYSSRKTAESRERKKKAQRLFADGKSVEEIVAIVGSKPTTVRKWTKGATASG